MADEFFESMLGDFLDESEELLASLNDNLLKLDEWVNALEDDSERFDGDLMNEMFRSAHSIKGLSAMMGLADINGLTHKIENVFDAARNDQLMLTPDIVERVFQAVDCLGQMVESLKDPNLPAIESEQVVASIKHALQNAGVDKEQGSQADIERVMSAQPASPSDSATAPADTGDDAVAADDPFAGVEDDGEVPAHYMEIFIDEAATALDALTDTLADINESASGEVVNELLVVVHRVKGCAASVGKQRAAKLAHFMEDILQELRDLQAPVTPQLAAALLACADGLRRYVDQLKTGRTDSDEFGQLVKELQTSYAATRVSVPLPEAPTGSTPATAGEVETPELPDWDEQRARILMAAPEGRWGIVGHVRLSAGQPLPGMKGQLIYEKLAQAGDIFFADPSEADIADLADLDGLTFGICTDVSAAELRRRIDVSGVDSIELAPFGDAGHESTDTAAEASPATAAGESAPKETESPPSSNPESGTPPAARAATRPAAEKSTPGAQAAAQADGNKPAETIRVDIERLDHLMNLAGQLVINKARFAQISDKLKHLAARKQSANAVNEVLTVLRKMDADLGDPARSSMWDGEAVRTHVRRMVGGLESVERDIANLAEARTGVSNLLEAVHQLDRVSDNLQKSVMDTRMVPIGPLFNRFKRVIRDITRGNGKEITLQIHGEKTELDKRMIDELGDPLVHMIRNAADHGIELPEDREAAGKPRQGVVSLNAYHSGNCIVVQLKDDGKGLATDKLLQKAIDKGIVSTADAEKFTHQQILQLIWEPGLSTAKQITDISGRGMGMDIVRSAIEELNGHVELDSVVGEGTTFTIKLPLTLAILPSLLANIDNNVFAMPIETVVEIVSIPNSDFKSVQGHKTASVRGRVVSVVDLFSVFDWRTDRRGQRAAGVDTTLVIVRSEGRELAMIVDELLGEEDIVIKSVSENYRNVQGIAGASILGDGRVSLILDVPTIIEMASAPARELAVT